MAFGTSLPGRGTRDARERPEDCVGPEDRGNSGAFGDCDVRSGSDFGDVSNDPGSLSTGGVRNSYPCPSTWTKPGSSAAGPSAVTTLSMALFGT